MLCYNIVIQVLLISSFCVVLFVVLCCVVLCCVVLYCIVVFYVVTLLYQCVGDFFIYDLGSTHNTFVNKQKIRPHSYVRLRNGDMFSIGVSTRLFIVDGGPEVTDVMLEKEVLKLYNTIQYNATQCNTIQDNT